MTEPLAGMPRPTRAERRIVRGQLRTMARQGQLDAGELLRRLALVGQADHALLARLIDPAPLPENEVAGHEQLPGGEVQHAGRAGLVAAAAALALVVAGVVAFLLAGQA
jgi:hypothetical protein